MAFEQWNFPPKWFYRRTDDASLDTFCVTLSVIVTCSLVFVVVTGLERTAGKRVRLIVNVAHR